MRIVRVTLWERAQMYALALIYGFYLIARRMLKWAWNGAAFFQLHERDTPPACLVDSTLGKHSYVKIKGIKFHYVEAGKRENPLVLLLHGFPDCWISWRKQMSTLAEFYRIISLDLKGFGDSDKPANSSQYSIEILIEELKEFIHAMGVQECILIGHDLGGLLGWYLAATHKSVIKNFIAISSPHPNFYWKGVGGESVFNQTWLHFSRLPILPEIDVRTEDLAVITATYKHLYSKKPSQQAEQNYIEAYKYVFSRKEDWTGPINYFRNLPFTRLYSEGREKIKTPTLLIIGNADKSISLEHIVQSTKYLEKFSINVVDKAGHFPHQENPEEVISFINEFLQSEEPVKEKPASKGIVSSLLGSTVKYGNQMFEAVHKRTNEVVNGLPGKMMLNIGQLNT
ncbi:epoxide hydrolase 4-like [Trichogramma pretiosum]|uniref:epoxide hydrolase 4-like n=1 Tax=Trichogramma pretiosum TaxID=7493 RepID=UPI0006C9C1F3|nr:epoxide hydrolase 4-like [Trichogramma pretiosum]